MRGRLAFGSALAVVCALAIWGCSGGNSSPSTPTAPTTPTTPTPPPTTPSTPTTITIVGNSGNTAFAPDVVTASVGDMISWKNSTSVLHHIVLDDGTVIGDINPGNSSTAVPLKTASGNFHCTIHPSMIGAFNAPAPPAPPPCNNPGYC